MADFSLPTVNDSYTNYLAYLKNRDVDLALGLDPATTTVTNPPTSAIRWNSANTYWEKFNGTSWAALAATYAINVTTLGGNAAALYALLASPAFTGVPTAPTAAGGTNTTQIATTAFVTSALTSYAPLASPALTGTPTAPTAAVNTNTTQLATTAYVVGQGYATLASPALTGTPTAPTAAVGTNTTQIATTAYVQANAVQKAGDTLTGSIGSTINTLTDAVTIAVDASLSNVFKVTLGGNRTLGNPTNSKDGNFVIHVIQDGTGSRTLAYGTNYKFAGGITPSLTLAINAIDILSCTVRSGIWYCSLLKDMK